MVHASLKDLGLTFAGYAELLDTLKDKIRSSQLKAAISVNTALIQLY